MERQLIQQKRPGDQQIEKRWYSLLSTQWILWSTFWFVLNRLEKLNKTDSFIFKFMSPITFWPLWQFLKGTSESRESPPPYDSTANSRWCFPLTRPPSISTMASEDYSWFQTSVTLKGFQEWMTEYIHNCEQWLNSHLLLRIEAAL